MQVVQRYPDGVFCWVDLTTPDQEAAKAFYSGLFGWEIDDRPIDMGGVYTMLQLEGKNVAGLGEMQPDMKAQGMPAFWTSYVKHDDVDSIAAKMSEAGGNLMFPPMDVMASGRMTVGTDSAGATFGVWQPREHIGAELVNMPNTLVWNELQTREPEAAKVFYQSVFGWTNAADENGYVTFSADGRMQAGMITMDENWGPEIPNNWSVYFMVKDVAAKVAQAEALGGKVMVPPTQAGEMGIFAVIADPQGGVFNVMSFNGPIDPPPGYEKAS
ncbi:VOC family protein [Candidatus Leptofilum sp.]|uniref:VOC family protein n=1 Tax=Candidatus Leptofilum sp. TaxID=3241576 RepID=UPI003B5C8729